MTFLNNFRSRDESIELQFKLIEKDRELKELKNQLLESEKTVGELQNKRLKDKQTTQKIAILLANSRGELADKLEICHNQIAIIQEKDTELEKLKSNLNDLNKENKHLHIELQSSKVSVSANESTLNEYKRIKAENSQLKSQVQSLKLRSDNLSQNSAKHLEELNESLSTQVVSLRKVIEDISMQNHTIKENYNNLKQITSVLVENRSEILTVIKSLKDTQVTNENYQKIIHQNTILQAVIKKLKSDRDQNCMEGEKRIKHLEEKINLLKKYYLRQPVNPKLCNIIENEL